MAEVTIGCKLPNGVYLDIIEPGTQGVDAAGKPMLGLQPKPLDMKRRVRLNGANSLRVKGQTTADEAHRFALTRVDKSFWETWVKQNSDLEFVRKGLVFVADSPSAAQSMAKERESERTGLEPLNPEKDDRTRGAVGDPDHLKALAASQAA